MEKNRRGLAQHHIDGMWVNSGTHQVSADPATGEDIGKYVMGTEAEATDAIDAAHRAFTTTSWAHDRELRARVLNRMADAFEERIPEVVELLGLENGKVHRHGELEVAIVPKTLRFNAALALTDTGKAAAVGPADFGMVVRQPAGVAGVIAPWNSPFALAVRSLAPALAAGATVVASMPSQTAQCNALLAEILCGVDELPAGVLNVVIGGRDTGDALVRSPRVPVVSFTGSTTTGKAISATAAENLKRLGLELGGKTPLVVFDDADLEATVPVLVDALTVFAGQFCMTGSRLLVHRAVAGEVVDALRQRLERLRIGPAADPASEMGPVLDKDNVNRIERLVNEAIEAGAQPVLRGGPFVEGPLSAGAFYSPTLLRIADSKLPIAQNEVFGPVMTIQEFTDDDEAVALANDSNYGLAAAIFTRDHERAVRLAQSIEAGTVWINTWAALFDQFEEGGFKDSGLGRMRGTAVLDDFLEYKHIQFVTTPAQS